MVKRLLGAKYGGAKLLDEEEVKRLEDSLREDPEGVEEEDSDREI